MKKARSEGFEDNDFLDGVWTAVEACATELEKTLREKEHDQ